MPPASLAPHLRAFAPDFAWRFALITAGLVALIARAFLRNPSLAPLIIPLYARLTRAATRCNRLMAFLAKHGRRAARRSGKASDTSAATSPSDLGARAPRQRPTIRIPTAEAWLIQTLRHEAGACRSQLAHLLAGPRVAELLAAAPAAFRFLRPICRMLGLTIPTPAAH